MSGYGYNVHNELYEARKKGARKETVGENGNIPYKEALDKIRERLIQKHAQDVRGAVESKKTADIVRGLISKYVQVMHISVEDVDTMPALVDRLYDDLLGFSFLTPFMYSPDVEEINCNRWNDIEIIYENRYEKLSVHFDTPEQAADIAKRMALLGGVVVDGAQPIADSYITKGIRIHVELPPVVDEDAGVFFSIRKQRSRTWTTEEYLQSGTATQDILDFLKLAASTGISTGFAGACGSGKTTDLNYVCNNLPLSKRIFCVEEDSRELNFIRHDEKGTVISRAVHTKTRHSDNTALNITATDLVRAALRAKPDAIVMAEMRGKEAIDVQEAGRTGHQIMNTFHANSARDAYTRYQSMCVSAQSGFSPEQLLTFCFESLPVMCFKEVLEDGRRKFTEIVEAVEGENGYTLVPIFAFTVTGHDRDENGHIQCTRGIDRMLNPISHALAYRMFKKGGDLNTIRRFRPDFDPLHEEGNA